MSQHPAAKSAKRLNELLRESLGVTPESIAARREAQKLLGFDDLNFQYFLALYRKRADGGSRRPLQIFEQGRPSAGKRVAYPISIAPPLLRKQVEIVEYEDLKRDEAALSEIARGAALWIKKMQAGTGSSMTRSSYLARRQGVPESQVRIGAKGTDLFVEARGKSIPMVEAQLLQSIYALQRRNFGEIIFHDILSSETRDSVARIWKKPSLPDPARSYDELVGSTPGLSRFRETLQYHVPTFDEQGQVSFNRLSPAGHALFAVDALRAACFDELRPRTDRPLVASISNGEDISATPDPCMIGWAVKNRVPITVVVTEKTAVDGKGGVLSLIEDEDGKASLAIVETAQAKEAGQLDLFVRLEGSANTNLALFNYEVLVPLLKKELQELGEDAFLSVITPDLISNVKEQRDSDGVTRKYLQLEGAMGSTLMNLDRHWRRRHGEPLVHVINVDRRHRTEFFSPLKFAFDFFLQFHSDRFRLDPQTMRLVNLRPGELPLVSLVDPDSNDKHYQDVQTVLDTFQGAQVLGLDSLTVEGKVRFAGSTLKGDIRVVNRTGQVLDLTNRTLENETIEK